MSSEFTQYSNNGLWASDDTPESALSYLNNPENFRPFSIGLSELMEKCGYTQYKTNHEKASFLYAQLTSLGISVTKSTISDWFFGKRRPSLLSNSRSLMYQVCFALSADFKHVKWFFSHVYFDRSFNCHTIEEAVYYYCFKNGLSYSKALDYMKQIQDFPSLPQPDAQRIVLTKEISRRLDSCITEDEFLDFFRENKSLFFQWNKTARLYITELLSEIRGKAADKAVIDQCRRGITILQKDLDLCGLITQEYLHNSQAHHIFETISGKNLASIDFMLDRILRVNTGLPRQTEIPEIVRTNFPSKKVFSDLLSKSDTSTAYDSIRKCLILLKFYHFWCLQLLHPEACDADLFDVYVDETNAVLTDCGYHEMYSGNPYDWLYLWASKTEDPLLSLRSAVGTMLDAL